MRQEILFKQLEYFIASATSTFIHAIIGGDLGNWGNGTPDKFEVGGRPMHAPPNILKSSVIGCVRKCELSIKKGVRKNFLV